MAAEILTGSEKGSKSRLTFPAHGFLPLYYQEVFLVKYVVLILKKDEKINYFFNAINKNGAWRFLHAPLWLDLRIVGWIIPEDF